MDVRVALSAEARGQLLDGICEEAVYLLKGTMCLMAVFNVLRKMNPLRQIETAELLINANNVSVSYAAAILAGTPQAQLAAIARMGRELSRLQEAIASVQDSYGRDRLHLTVVKGYLRKLITNDRVAHYLEQYQSDIFIEFLKIAEMTTTLPSQAA